MYAYAVGLADALWLCPECALRLFFASVSFVDPVRTVAPLSRHVFAGGVSPLRAVALEETFPMCWVLSEAMGLAVAPPISPYSGPGQSP